MSSKSELQVIGKITGTHGIHGMVRVHLYSGDDSTLRAASELFLRHSDGREQPLKFASLRPHRRKPLLSLVGYSSINDVLPLIGGELVVRRDQFPEPDNGEYYWADLIGLRVVTDDGGELGTLREIIETGSNDVYVVQGREKEYLIPAMTDIVQKIDLEAGMMTVAPPEGLLDL